MKLMVNIGGVKNRQKQGWKNLNYQGEWYKNKGKNVHYWHDLTSEKPLPFKDGSVYLFYSQHTFEHISDICCEHVFAEVYRSLKKDGGFRIVVPDMDLAYEKYKNRDEKFFGHWMGKHRVSMDQAFVLLFAKTHINNKMIKRNFVEMDKIEFFDFYTKGLKQNPTTAGHHINWFNADKLAKMLKGAGFRTIYKSEPQKSAFKEIKGPSFDRRRHWSLFMEAIK